MDINSSATDFTCDDAVSFAGTDADISNFVVLYNENHLLELSIAIYTNDCAVPEGIKVISTPIEIRLANGKLAWTFIVYSRLLIVAVNDLRDFLFR